MREGIIRIPYPSDGSAAIMTTGPGPFPTVFGYFATCTCTGAATRSSHDCYSNFGLALAFAKHSGAVAQKKRVRALGCGRTRFWLAIDCNQDTEMRRPLQSEYLNQAFGLPGLAGSSGGGGGATG